MSFLREFVLTTVRICEYLKKLLTLAVKSYCLFFAFKFLSTSLSRAGINGRYKLVTQQMDWASAEKHCNSMKARLAIIANATEQQAIVKYLSKFKCQ